jgi:hypothetical protein
MRSFVVGVWLVLGVVCGARAQLTVQVRAERDTFLLYESIPLEVGIRNFSGRNLSLENQNGEPWLGFIVSDETGALLKPVAPTVNEDAVLIAPSQTVVRKIDVMPLFDLRARGNYVVQARVAGLGGVIVSAPFRFTIINGRELWSTTIGLPSDQAGGEEYRTYSLVAKRAEQREALYACVRDEPNHLVYGMLALGPYIGMGPPEARLDKAGNLHVLYQGAPRAFGYAQVDPWGKLVSRAVYSDYLSRPRLVALTMGDVRVNGGEQTYPRAERVMSDEELKPPQPVATPKPKRRWWWPFSGRS